MFVPVVVVLGLMALSLVGASAARRAILRVTATPGLQSLSVTPGQQVLLTPPPGGSWTLVAMIVNNSAVQLPYPSPTGPVTITVPPAITSLAASWMQNGVPQGAILLLVPPGKDGTSVVTDPGAVAYAQLQLTNLAAKGRVPGLAYAQYSSPSSSPTFAQGLTTFQTWANANVLHAAGVQIRVDGQLDYATFSLLTSAASGF
jgi:hypothetical protein